MISMLIITRCVFTSYFSSQHESGSAHVAAFRFKKVEFIVEMFIRVSPNRRRSLDGDFSSLRFERRSRNVIYRFTILTTADSTTVLVSQNDFGVKSITRSPRCTVVDLKDDTRYESRSFENPSRSLRSN